MILQSLQFILFCVRKMILYQIVVLMSKGLFHLMTLYNSLTRGTWWLMQILIAVLSSSLKLLQKSDRSTENGITFPDPVKNPNALSAKINIPVLLMSSIALISFWTRTVYGTWFQQLLCYSTTLMIHTLCSISTLNQQLHNLNSNPVFSSLQTMDSKRKGLRVSFAFFRRNYLQDGRVNETVATVEEFSDLWNPGAMDGAQPFVMNCNCI